jgi:DNA-binding SARP family transcriptional activator/tetratricopeptide (TPR) repeat protein
VDQERPSAAGTELTIRLLGPLEVAVGGRLIDLTTGRLRTLLAVLALSAGQPVSVDRLVTALWDEAMPDNARRGVQTYLTRLRGALGAGTISTVANGYLLHADPDQIDALRFGRLLDDAARAADPAIERTRLAEALALWCGTPFDGIQSGWLERSVAPPLTERYLAAVERRIDLDAALGHHGDPVAELRELTGQHPLRESLWVRLLVALDRSGRPAEALRQYEAIRERLADELGTDPGPELRQVHADLLAGIAPQRSGLVESGWPVPRQLPADIPGFTGRDTPLKTLNDLTTEDGGPIANTVAIAVIAGAAGIGKTALAVHWAHQIADRFPDGQLYLNLRGFHPSGQVMAPAEAVRGFLDALGVPPERVPSDPDAQAGLYRSLLAGKRVLVLLDNARDAAQVRPLLPGSPTCLVAVTSRHQLTGLVAAEAAQLLVLDAFPPDEAHAMLAHRLGADRLDAEPAATREIIGRCDRLPLALAIVAARAAGRAGHPLETLAAELRDTRHGGLAALSTGDTSTDVRAVFSWSYQTLSPAAARLFRMLGLHPGPDLSLPAAASVAALPAHQVRELLAELTQVHLLTEQSSGRYAFHDLLRAFAFELAERHDPADLQYGARGRMLDHYLHTAHAGAMRLSPKRPPIRLAEAKPGVVPEPLDDLAQATGWFAAERAVLVAAADQAYQHGFDRHTWQLAWSLTTFLDRRGDWHELAAAQRVALAAATRSGDLVGRACTYRNQAVADFSRGRYGEASTNLEQALDLFQQLGDLPNQARTRLGLAQAAIGRGRPTAALKHTREALDLYRATGQPAGEAEALNGIAWCHAQLGEHRAALEHGEQALDLVRELGDRSGEAAVLDTLGYAHHHLGHYRQAATYYHQTLDLFRELGEARYAAEALVHLGDTYAAAGQADAARDALHQALAILDELDHPDAAQLRDRLARLDAGP